MAYNYNTGANKRARKVASSGNSTPLTRHMMNHPKAGTARVVGAIGGLVGAQFSPKGAAVGATLGAGAGALAGKYGRVGRMHAMSKGMKEPQLNRHGFSEHPNQRNAKTAVRSSSPSQTRSLGRVGSK